MKSLWLASLVGAATLASCTHNYKQEWRGQTPLRIRNLTAHTVDAVKLVPETMHDPSGNWLTSPIAPNGEITFTIKDGGYWFKAEGTAGPIKIDTGNSMNSAFGRLLIVKGATELVLFDRKTPANETETSQQRITFSFDTAAPPEENPAPAPVPPAPSEGSAAPPAAGSGSSGSGQ